MCPLDLFQLSSLQSAHSQEMCWVRQATGTPRIHNEVPWTLLSFLSGCSLATLAISWLRRETTRTCSAHPWAQDTHSSLPSGLLPPHIWLIHSSLPFIDREVPPVAVVLLLAIGMCFLSWKQREREGMVSTDPADKITPLCGEEEKIPTFHTFFSLVASYEQ